MLNRDKSHLGEVMTKKTNNNPSKKNKSKYKAQRFQVSYSLNNWQPVLCTHISDQPFFYMDDEVQMDDESLLDNYYLENFEEEFSEEMFDELCATQKKIQAYDRFSEDSKKFDSLETFITDSKSIEPGIYDLEFNGTLDEIKQTISLSRMAQNLYDIAIEQNIEIILTNQVQLSAYDVKSKKIFIRQDMNVIDQVLLLVQELRRHWQNINGAMINPMSLHPEQAILINRAQKADLAVAIVRCAWEMKLQGYENIWARIENSSFSDLGRALAREALNDFRTLNNGIASSALFETWFLSERSNHTDKILIQKMLADYRGYMFANDQPCHNQAMQIISQLGEQPFGQNYLSAYAAMIAHDSLFTDVRDRSNANFLWFIKFERKYQEAEKELNLSDDVSDTSGSEVSSMVMTLDEMNHDNVIHVQF
jgi:hypothetical protein